jgi:hypothetical protein
MDEVENKNVIKSNRLAKNFHLTFIPERQYINSFLKFCASGGEGNYQEISLKTGIPMGKSSGKVPAILNYCIGMGLITLSDNCKKGKKKPEFTTFGRTVLLNDPFLKESVTQWISHFNLCDPISGADVWYHCFFKGINILGLSFSNEDIKKYISVVYGTKRANIVSPMIRMYQDDSSFSNCGVLQQRNNLIIRKKAPTIDKYALAYGAWLLCLLNKYFPNQNQVSVEELENQAGWLSITGWDSLDVISILELVQRKGLLDIDRTMNPWLLKATKDSNEAWKEIYDDMI